MARWVLLPRKWRRAEAFRRAKAALKVSKQPRRKLWSLVHRIMEAELPRVTTEDKIYVLHQLSRKRHSSGGKQ
jgi:hypothetical protein